VTVRAVQIFIRPHRSRPTTCVDAAYCYRTSSVVCRSVGLSITLVSHAKTAEPIEMPFGLWKLRWDRGTKEACVTLECTNWRNLANTAAPSTCGGDAAFLSNYFDHLLSLSLVYIYFYHFKIADLLID